LLVLDELGVSTGGRDEFPALYEVLNHRHGEELPTVLTTNVPIEQFVEAFGDRIADRLATARFCQLKGESWRKPK
jgi:DNA replication protein DnaC